MCYPDNTHLLGYRPFFLGIPFSCGRTSCFHLQFIIWKVFHSPSHYPLGCSSSFGLLILLKLYFVCPNHAVCTASHAFKCEIQGCIRICYRVSKFKTKGQNKHVDHYKVTIRHVDHYQILVVLDQCLKFPAADSHYTIREYIFRTPFMLHPQ